MSRSGGRVRVRVGFRFRSRVAVRREPPSRQRVRVRVRVKVKVKVKVRSTLRLERRWDLSLHRGREGRLPLLRRRRRPFRRQRLLP